MISTVAGADNANNPAAAAPAPTAQTRSRFSIGSLRLTLALRGAIWPSCERGRVRPLDQAPSSLTQNLTDRGIHERESGETRRFAPARRFSDRDQGYRRLCRTAEVETAQAARTPVSRGLLHVQSCSHGLRTINVPGRSGFRSVPRSPRPRPRQLPKAGSR